MQTDKNNKVKKSETSWNYIGVNFFFNISIFKK